MESSQNSHSGGFQGFRNILNKYQHSKPMSFSGNYETQDFDYEGTRKPMLSDIQLKKNYQDHGQQYQERPTRQRMNGLNSQKIGETDVNVPCIVNDPIHNHPQMTTKGWLYPIQSNLSTGSRLVHRSFAQFEFFKNLLMVRYIGSLIPSLPSQSTTGIKKKVFRYNNSFSVAFDDCRDMLQLFLNHISQNQRIRSSEEYSNFLTYSCDDYEVYKKENEKNTRLEHFDSINLLYLHNDYVNMESIMAHTEELKQGFSKFISYSSNMKNSYSPIIRAATMISQMKSTDNLNLSLQNLSEAIRRTIMLNENFSKFDMQIANIFKYYVAWSRENLYSIQRLDCLMQQKPRVLSLVDTAINRTQYYESKSKKKKEKAEEQEKNIREALKNLENQIEMGLDMYKQDLENFNKCMHRDFDKLLNGFMSENYDLYYDLQDVWKIASEKALPLPADNSNIITVGSNIEPSRIDERVSHSSPRPDSLYTPPHMRFGIMNSTLANDYN